VIQPGRPASSWPLDLSAGTSEIDRLRRVLERRAPAAAWHSSDEPKAIATAQRLTAGPVSSRPQLREAHRSDWFVTQEEFRAAVLDAFGRSASPGRPGWEPLDATRMRVSAVVVQLVAQLADDHRSELVLVGHGTAWTLLVSEITGAAPDVAAWMRLRTPDLCTIDLETRTIRHPWGDW
jgi:broad specificity phosphatase PhoE